MALSLLKRLVKGSKLTHSEMDNNLSLIEEAVDGKAAIEHTHTIGNVSGLEDALDALTDELADKAPTTHVHTIDDVDGLLETLDSKMLLEDRGFGRVVAMGRIQLTGGESVEVNNSEWHQDGAGNCQLILSYDRSDNAPENYGLLFPMATTTGNNYFKIKSSNVSDDAWVLWTIIKAY